MEPPPPPRQHQLRILETVQLHPPLADGRVQAGSFPLSGLDTDHNVLDVTFRTLRFFPPHPPSLDPFDVLPRAFAAALDMFVPLAGRLGDGGRVVRTAADTVPLVLAASDLSVADLDTDSPCSALVGCLAPGDGDGVMGSPALALQATRFACGGVALGMRVAHALCDGAGATKFLSAAARFARGVQEPAVAPVWERQARLGPRRPPRVVKPFDRVLALDAAAARHGPYGATGDAQAQITRECFHVSDARVETLRAGVAGEAGLKLPTFEFLAAFIWRARVKAKGTSPDEVVKMVYSMNISKLLAPPLPDGYWGNVCVPVYVALTAGELVGQPLAETAAMIKKSKQEVDDEYVRSYIDLRELRHGGEGVVTAGRGVSAFTDWRRLGHSEVDFGWGAPDAVLPLSWRLLGSTEPCFFLPYGAGDERRRLGFKVLAAVPPQALPCFREEMQELSSQRHCFHSKQKL
ncbi:3'-N-debenzoyl-2'-deoxytaxol N-benzoyltransferase-like [Oryza brachyantha]|uniref:Putative EIG-I24 n=1 Tax=Oryza brachyantha TaxID=4533 RepID=A0A1V1H7T3_ORYBR|nr:3'-N-debenzoyl-2'-deoxytaxol N-benzoyltransferase-like [Oryza brachyantha]BAX25105.1 putative EIG-I24 [Oryza brachyantha]